MASSKEYLDYILEQLSDLKDPLWSTIKQKDPLQAGSFIIPLNIKD